jgi:signal transduction histidine kinase
MSILRDTAPSVWPSPPDREAWVQMKLIQAFMRNARLALTASTLSAVFVVLVLYGDVDIGRLGAWSLAIALILLWRGINIRRYRRSMTEVSGLTLHRFMTRAIRVSTASGAIWGALAFVFFRQAPIYHQFICMSVVIASPGFSVGTFSSYLRGFTHYVDAVMGMLVAALVYLISATHGGGAGFDNWGMVVFALIYWAVIRASGHRMHAVQRANLELQFDNEMLVASLTEKSRAALDAVDVKNRFIASAAHDLRQPVHALALYASWLSSEPDLVNEIAPKIVRSTRAVNDLFDSLFDFVGLDSDTLRAKLQAVDLHALVQDLHLQYEPVARERGLQLRVRISPVEVSSDPVLLKRLLGNLISNAIKNTYQGGVLVAIRRRAGRWHIQVWDTGTGIAPEHQQAIFREFYRVPQLGTEEGFGLGLAIVSRLSSTLAHPIKMVSRVGRGSVFWLELD